MNQRLLITDDVHPLLIEGFEQRGFRCDYLPQISYGETLDIIANYTGLIINSKILVKSELLSRAPDLRFVARLGSGLEIIDLPLCKSQGVAVISSPEGNCRAVAEHALGLLLCLCNNILRADAEVRRKHWAREKNRGIELSERTLGIVGFGHTGSTLATLLSGWGTRVLAYDKYLPAGYASRWKHVEEVSLEQLRHESDVISFHLPLTPETKHYCDTRFLSDCRQGVIILNTSRGQVIDTAALIDALISAQVSAAGLDVFENEKTETFSATEEQLYQSLYQLDNVILTPHVAGWTQESKRKLSEIILQKYDLLFSQS